MTGATGPVRSTMSVDKHRYRGFIVKLIDAGKTWRATVYDPMKQGNVWWDHFAISGINSREEAIKRCYAYVDEVIDKESRA
jgi:hypothetical protein